MKNTSIIIPSKNWDNLRPCLGAILEKDPKFITDGKVIVVDDGLSNVMEALTIFPIKVVQGIKPFIFSRNVNLGILAAGVDDIIILNDDALLETNLGFTKLVEIARAHPEFGVVRS